jgi:hypothetical protein
MHKGISKTFQNESITKYMLTFVITSCCCSLQSSSLLSLCNTLSISSTDGSINASAFWNHVQKSHQLLLNFGDIVETMFPTPIPVTLFFKTRKGQIRQVMRVGNYSHVFSSRELLLFLLVGPSNEYGTSEYSST